ncbi:MAG: hypothetical protein WA210_19600, partial [Burkholderiaceae bacterium]
MHRYWPILFEPMLRLVRPAVVAELGCGDGALTRTLLRYCSQSSAQLRGADPQPRFDHAQWQREHAEVFSFTTAPALSALEQIVQGAQVLFVHGEPNWYTTISLLRLLARQARQGGAKFPLTFLGQTGWPYARRDGYPEPQRIPAEFRQPFAVKGVRRDTPELAARGGADPELAHALLEHSLQNGVLTAVEDFVAESKLRLAVHRWTPFGGVAFIAPGAVLQRTTGLSELLDSLQAPQRSAELLEAVECARAQAQIAAGEQAADLRDIRLRQADALDLATRAADNAQVALADLRLRESELRGSFGALETTRDAQTQRIAALEAESRLRCEVEAADAKFLQDELRRRDAQTREHQAQLGKTQQQLAELELAREQWLATQARSSESSAAQLQQLQRERDDLRVEAALLRGALDAARHDTGTKQAALAASEAAVAAGAAALASTREELARAHDELRRIGAERDRALHEGAAAGSNLAETLAQRDSLLSANAALHESQQHQQEALAQTRGRIAELEPQLRMAQDEWSEAARREAAGVERESALATRNDALQASLAAKEAELASTREELSRSNDELRRLGAEHDRALHDSAAAGSELAATLAQRDALLSANSELHESQRLVQDTLVQTRSSVSVLELQLRIVQEEFSEAARREAAGIERESAGTARADELAQRCAALERELDAARLAGEERERHWAGWLAAQTVQAESMRRQVALSLDRQAQELESQAREHAAKDARLRELDAQLGALSAASAATKAELSSERGRYDRAVQRIADNEHRAAGAARKLEHALKS